MLGIDIGTKNIKIVNAVKKSDEFYDITADMVAIPANANAKTRDKTVSQLLRSLVRKNGIKEKVATASIGNPDIVIRKLDFPNMPRGELSNTIKLQAERLIYTDLNKMDTDFDVRNREDKEGMDVIFVAIEKEMVTRHMKLIQDGGLEPVIIDVDNLAMGNSYLSFEPNAPNESVLLMNIGHSKTCFTIVSEGNFCFTKSISFGGKDITEEIKKEMDISYEKADVLKKKTEQWDEVGMNIKNILRKCSADLLEAIYRSVEYCKSQGLLQSIDRMLLTGGSARLGEIDSFFNGILGMPAEIWNPFNNIKLLRDKKLGEYMSVALGAAMRRYSTGYRSRQNV
ncbi:MAG: type IV pilus assembly protein PilM [Elusimicrobiota bacterium]